MGGAAAVGASSDAVDLDRIGSLIDDARQALRTRSTIDRALCHIGEQERGGEEPPRLAPSPQSSRP